jgi:hypothetical protein
MHGETLLALAVTAEWAESRAAVVWLEPRVALAGSPASLSFELMIVVSPQLVLLPVVELCQVGSTIGPALPTDLVPCATQADQAGPQSVLYASRRGSSDAEVCSVRASE